MDFSTLDGFLTAKEKRAEYKYRYRMGGGVKHVLMIDCCLEI